MEKRTNDEKDGQTMERDGQTLEIDGQTMEKDGQTMEKTDKRWKRWTNDGNDGQTMEKTDKRQAKFRFYATFVLLVWDLYMSLYAFHLE